MTRSPPIHRAPLSRREALLFEAGVKLGGIFHQYLGIPVTPRTAPGLARTIERAVSLQPFVVSVRATIDPRRGGPMGRGRFAYRYLNPEMIEVPVLPRDGPEAVEARFAHRADLRYPLMSVIRVRGPVRGSPPRRRAA